MFKQVPTIEKAQNEIIEIIVKYHLKAEEIIIILELIKLDILAQLYNRKYVQIEETSKIPTNIQIQPKPAMPEMPKEDKTSPKDTVSPNN